MTRLKSALIASLSIILIHLGTPDTVIGAEDDVGPPPLIISPEEGAWYACNAPVNYVGNCPKESCLNWFRGMRFNSRTQRLLMGPGMLFDTSSQLAGITRPGTRGFMTRFTGA